MAHVLDLPGCFARANSRSQCLDLLVDTIHETHAWLRRHAEPAPLPEDPIIIEIAYEELGIGPFNPGDAAACFPPEREPLSEREHTAQIRQLLLCWKQAQAD